MCMYVYINGLNPPTASLQVRWVEDSPAQTGSGVKGLFKVISKSVAKRGKVLIFLPGNPATHRTALGQVTKEMKPMETKVSILGGFQGLAK